jgi:hypothetical protein
MNQSNQLNKKIASRRRADFLRRATPSISSTLSASSSPPQPSQATSQISISHTLSLIKNEFLIIVQNFMARSSCLTKLQQYCNLHLQI